ncbi:DHHC palmitoyltransferase-domain-containing protein [Chytriomyces sp. MP71]|nr:DHHC palmitoyltransferase-domain-containing protein [Chytriomyces sp. MP71]
MVATLLGLFPQFIPSSPLLIPTLALIAALVFLHIVLFFGTIFIDPQDLATKQSHRDTTYTHRRGFPVINAYSRICGICCVDVDARTYHCKQCNKCTAGFDHHCVWVNCCVGEANYRWFIGVVGVGWVLVTVFTAATAWIVGVYSQERTRFEYVVTSLVSKSPPGMSKAIVAYVCLMLIVGILSFMAISALLWFHIKINILGLTTLGYIELEQELKQTDTPTALHQLSAWRNLRDRLRKRTDTWSFSSGPFSARRETGR